MQQPAAAVAIAFITRLTASPPRRSLPISDERGFTLLEVMVACVIAVLAFGAVFHTALSGAATARNAGTYQAALTLARSRMAMLGRDVTDRMSEGDDGPFHWHVQVAREAVAEPGPGVVNWFLHKGEARPTLFAVSVAVSWQAAGRREEIQLATKRLGFTAPLQAEP